MVLPGKITAQGWALAPIALATRPQGAPLTVILSGKRMPGTEDGPGPVCRHEALSLRYGGHRRPAEAGQPDLAAAARPQGYRPKGRDMAAAPSRTAAPPALPLGPGGGARLSHASLLDDFASPCRVRAISPPLGVPKARP